ncbi:hypothetical protein pb186bvf_016026 [Paramecium bursaria]
MIREASFSNYFVDSQKFQEIKVLVSEARILNYRSRVSSLQHQCYIRQVRVSYGNQVLETTVQNSENLNPKWNEYLIFQFQGWEQITLEILDNFIIIGASIINLKELTTKNKSDWYSVFDRKSIIGSLRLNFNFEQKQEIDKLNNIYMQLETKLKQQRITSPTVGSLQMMHQIVKFKHTHSNIINSNSEFEYIKQLMTEIKAFQSRIQKISNKSHIKQRQKELLELQETVQQKSEEISQQEHLVERLSRTPKQLTKKDLILLKYQKKANVLTQIKYRLNEAKYHHEKRVNSLAVQSFKHEYRLRNNNSEFQKK